MSNSPNDNYMAGMTLKRDKSYDEAYKYFKMAADYQHANALYECGVHLFHKWANYKFQSTLNLESLGWFNGAVRMGHEHAKVYVNLLSNVFSSVNLDPFYEATYDYITRKIDEIIGGYLPLSINYGIISDEILRRFKDDLYLRSVEVDISKIGNNYVRLDIHFELINDSAFTIKKELILDEEDYTKGLWWFNMGDHEQALEYFNKCSYETKVILGNKIYDEAEKKKSGISAKYRPTSSFPNPAPTGFISEITTLISRDYKMAADLDHMSALKMMWNWKGGPGMTVHMPESLKYLKRAADLGDYDSCIELKNHEST